MQHKNLARTWGEKSLAYQMGNIGSEVYRALNYKDNPTRFQGAFDRALELFDLTIEAAIKTRSSSTVKELCRAREEFCDYFYGHNLHTDPIKMQKYYDQFAMLLRV